MARRVRLKTTERGYGGSYLRNRRAVDPLVRAGLAVCAICGEPIPPDADWHLGHSDDRLSLIGPTHGICNTREAGLKAARLARGERTVTSQRW